MTQQPPQPHYPLLQQQQGRPTTAPPAPRVSYFKMLTRLRFIWILMLTQALKNVVQIFEYKKINSNKISFNFMFQLTCGQCL